ncbi:Cyst_wall protein [Hexamita inflata]|uniref:Cyst_wall protein n=1 Tax=Hexamita inflata TaxID=28002 RepID=A0ABP1GWQ6_9EUKA
MMMLIQIQSRLVYIEPQCIGLSQLDILLSIYHQQNGTQWINATNWGNTNISICMWAGVTCVNNIVLELDMEGFGLVGQLAEQVFCLTSLQKLNIRQNQMNSSISTGLCQLFNLIMLDAQQAGLVGSIPQCICNMTNVQSLQFSLNQLSGVIPQCNSMNYTQNLVNFSASCNNLTGDIPESFDSLQNLVYVDVKCNSQLNCSTHHTQPINLGTAEKYSILAETAITTTGSTVISGDMGISPNGASSITGFQLSLDVSGKVSSAPNVNGNIYASDYTPTTPGDLTIAINDMETAYTIASQSIPSATELGGGSIGGINFVPGVYIQMVISSQYCNRYYIIRIQC